MAKRRPDSQRSTPKGTSDDAFTAGVLEFTAWARQRTEVLIGAIVVAVLIVVGGLYWMNQRAEHRAQAAAELESLQQVVSFAPPDEAVGSLREFLARFGGTPYAVEARLVLAEVLLGEDRADEAVDVLDEVAPSFRDPLRLQATILLAKALEQAGELERAADVYGRLSQDAEFAYQRREATDALARVHLARGDTAAAAAAYRDLLSEMEAEAENRGYFEMRLAELTGGNPS